MQFNANSDAGKLSSFIGPDWLSQLRASGLQTVLPQGSRLYSEADDKEQIYLVEEGAFKLVTRLSEDRELIVAFALCGDILGCLVGRPCTHSCIAVTESKVLAIAFSQFRDDVLNGADASIAVSNILLEKMNAARRLSLLLGRARADEKVAAFLAQMAGRQGFAHQFANNEAVELDLPMSRRDIADHLGLTIETVSRQFSALQASGFIEQSSRRTLRVARPEEIKGLAA